LAEIVKLNEKIQSKKHKVRKSKNKEYQSYELESIVNHKTENNMYLFLVKWKNYPDSYNSWLTIDKFNEKSMLSQYIKDNNLGIL